MNNFSRELQLGGELHWEWAYIQEIGLQCGVNGEGIKVCGEEELNRVRR